MMKRLTLTLAGVALASLMLTTGVEASTVLSSSQQVLYQVDVNTGAFRTVGAFDPSDSFLGPADIVQIAVYPGNGGLYGVQNNQDHFYSINPGNGQASIVANFGNNPATGQPREFLGFGAAPDPLDNNNWYLWGTSDREDALWRIDPISGAIEKRGSLRPTGVSNVNITDVAWDGSTMWGVDNEHRTLVEVDLTTGQANGVGFGWDLTDDARLNGLVYDPDRDTLVAQAQEGTPGFETTGALYDIDRVSGLASNPRGPSGAINDIGTGDLAPFAGAVVPEPSTIALGLLGFLAVAYRRFRRS